MNFSGPSGLKLLGNPDVLATNVNVAKTVTLAVSLGSFTGGTLGGITAASMAPKIALNGTTVHGNVSIRATSFGVLAGNAAKIDGDLSLIAAFAAMIIGDS